MGAAAVPWVVSMAVSAAGAAYGAHQQDSAAEKAKKAQQEAVKQQEEELRKKGPEAVQSSADSAETARRKDLLRAGILANIKTGRYGLAGAANTAGNSLTGNANKTTLGA